MAILTVCATVLLGFLAALGISEIICRSFKGPRP